MMIEDDFRVRKREEKRATSGWKSERSERTMNSESEE